MISILMPIMVGEDWLETIAHASIEVMLRTASMPYQLVIVETGEHRFDPGRTGGRAYGQTYVHRPERTTFVKDLNAGLAVCEGEFVVHTACDIFVRPGWMEAMLKPFDKLTDCGVSCLASNDLKMDRADKIVEGVYGPHMMFRRQWPDGTPVLFDPDYADIWSDTDLVMKHYRQGLRSYRNYGIVIDHFNRLTYDGLYDKQAQEKRLEAAKQMFISKHAEAAGHLRVFHYFTQGVIF